MKTKNPLGLRIGARVLTTASCQVEYDDEDNRIVRITHFPKPRQTHIIGVAKKALGKYIPVSRLDNAYLKVREYIWLYKCKDKIDSKSFLVRPEDIPPGVG